MLHGTKFNYVAKSAVDTERIKEARLILKCFTSRALSSRKRITEIRKGFSRTLLETDNQRFIFT